MQNQRVKEQLQDRPVFMGVVVIILVILLIIASCMAYVAIDAQALQTSLLR